MIGSEAQRPPASNTTEGRPDEDYLTPVEYGDNLFSNAASTNKRNKADTSLLFGDEMDGEIRVLWRNLDRAPDSPFFISRSYDDASPTLLFPYLLSTSKALMKTTWRISSDVSIQVFKCSKALWTAWIILSPTLFDDHRSLLKPVGPCRPCRGGPLSANVCCDIVSIFLSKEAYCYSRDTPEMVRPQTITSEADGSDGLDAAKICSGRRILRVVIYATSRDSGCSKTIRKNICCHCNDARCPPVEMAVQ